MSTLWNYGPGWEDALFEAYGVESDHERLTYYRDLWNASRRHASGYRHI